MVNCYARLIFLAIAITGLFYGAKGQNIGFDIIGNRTSVEIPFESHNNLIVIPVILNHRMPLRFVVDTGVANIYSY